MNQSGVFIPVGESASDPKTRINPAVLIPVFDHEQAVGQTLDQVLEYDYPVLIVDDGSTELCRDTLVELRDRYAPQVSLLRLEQNEGKGAAIKIGFKALMKQGFSHVVQIDADGQHEISDLPRFIETAGLNPDSIVTGNPVFDEDVPRARYYGRYLTHIWVWINTLSFAIRDSMCGFRVYPLPAVVTMLDQENCGNRMEFDTEVIVKWHWRGGGVINLPTRVHYPRDGVSHFDVWRDNYLISLMHTRLFFGMLYRLPGILWRRVCG